MAIWGEVFALIDAILYAVSNIFTRKALDVLDKDAGMVITLLVNIILYGLLLLVLWLTGYWVAFDSRSLVWLVLAGFMTSFSGRYLMLESVLQNGPSRAGAFKKASPVFTFLVGIFLLGEVVSSLTAVGAVIVIAGLVVISFRSKARQPDAGAAGRARQGIRLTPRGILIGISSGISFGLGQILRKIGVSFWPFSPGGALVGAITALAITVIYISVSRREALPWRLMASRASLNYVWSGLCTGTAIIFFFLSLLYIPVAVANVLGAVEPLFTIVLAYFFLRSREHIDRKLIIGAAAVTVGTAIIFFS